MASYYNKSTLIQILKDQAQALGRTPQPEDMTEPSAQVFIRYFKKWKKALKAADLTPKAAPKQATPPTEVDIETTPAKKVSAPVDVPQLAKEEVAPVKEEEVSIDNSQPTQRRYSKSIISKMLLDEFNRLGKKPTRKEIDANKDLPTVSTCLKYFDTTRIGDVWAEVLKDE